MNSIERLIILPLSLSALALGACSDDDFFSGTDKGAYTDLAGDTATVPDSNGLPDGYGPLYSCKNPGMACNAHDTCAINPVCGPDGKCYPESVMNCNDGLACTTDTCAGLGVCDNKPKAGTCKLLVVVPKGTTCAALKADAGVLKFDSGVPNDAGISPGQTESITCCFQSGDRNPADTCMQCNPPATGDASTGGTSAIKWSPANGGYCDDGNACTKGDYCQTGTCKGTSYLSQCSDSISCTTDLCDGKGGCLGNKLKTGWCLINSTCYKDGAPHPNGTCLACVSSKNPADWSAVTNTCSIGGKCYVKGAKHSGGCAECDPATSASAWSVTGATHCLINNACVAAGAKDSTGCSSCQPTVNKYAYSPLTGLCLIDSKCHTKGTKNTGGCAECAPATSTSKWTVTGTTHCLISDKCYTSGTADTSGCASCVPASNKYDWTAKTGMCKIDSKCYADGTAHTGGCGKCVAATSPNKWTVTKANTCLISDKCYNAGDKLGCFQCDPTTSTTAWTQISGCVSMDLDVGTHSSNYTASQTRGMWFVAPVSFTIISLRVPVITGATSLQNIQVVKFAATPPTYSASTTNHTTLLFKKGAPAAGWVSANLAITKGDIIGILGARGTGSSITTSYGPKNNYITKISNVSTTLTRLVYQTAITTAQAGALSTEAGGNLGRIEMKYKP